MGLLRALEARLRDGECCDGDDGYYVRTHDGRKLGPMHGDASDMNRRPCGSTENHCRWCMNTHVYA